MRDAVIGTGCGALGANWHRNAQGALASGAGLKASSFLQEKIQSSFPVAAKYPANAVSSEDNKINMYWPNGQVSPGCVVLPGEDQAAELAWRAVLSISADAESGSCCPCACPVCASHLLWSSGQNWSQGVWMLSPCVSLSKRFSCKRIHEADFYCEEKSSFGGGAHPALRCISSEVSRYSAGRRGLEILLALIGARISVLHKTSAWVSSMALPLPP